MFVDYFVNFVCPEYSLLWFQCMFYIYMTMLQCAKAVPQPKSPDPDIPEWDWDDGSSHSDKVNWSQ